MKFLLPFLVRTEANPSGSLNASPCNIDSQTDTTFTMTRILPPGCWSANVITIQKSACTEVTKEVAKTITDYNLDEFPDTTFWTTDEATLGTSVLSWE